jgi:hypothetical protein
MHQNWSDDGAEMNRQTHWVQWLRLEGHCNTHVATIAAKVHLQYLYIVSIVVATVKPTSTWISNLNSNPFVILLLSPNFYL